eukprot:TRINITY_DN3106_c0_g1_i2.p1 TRINITY_DN3106_c0_g1~~TRINITY_DN3106_c0_g1_i2.p1  ORF type:complete len:170 (-),score=37.55 TRINITY_DN3106_c0_g1_i2:227-736(-)
MIARCSHLIHDWISSYTTLGKYDEYAVYVCWGSGFFLACVGAINEKEDNSLHSGSAILFFVCSIVYMWYQALRISKIMKADTCTLRRQGPVMTQFSFNLKLVLSGIATVFFACFIYFSSDWSKYHIQIAVCEWAGVGLIIVRVGLSRSLSPSLSLSLPLSPSLVIPSAS